MEESNHMADKLKLDGEARKVQKAVARVARVVGRVDRQNLEPQICNRMDSWENGKFDMLVQDTHRTATAQLSKMQGQEMEDQRGKAFLRLVL
jgi:hypothetical protein